MTQALHGAAPPPQLGRGRHGCPTGFLAACHGGHHRLSHLRPSLRYAILFALGALLSGLTIRLGVNAHDEGLMLQAGERIADGQLPYRDFYANYGPGQYFLVGGLDVLFGPSLLTWRIVRVLLDAGVALMAYVLVRRDAPEPLALGAWVAVAAAMAYPSLPHPNPTALALGLGGLLLAERRPALAGALAGLAIVFRFDIGHRRAGRRGAARRLAHAAARSGRRELAARPRRRRRAG